MKICFLAGTLGRGGAEKQLLYMLRALKNAGVEARLLCLTKDESYEQEIKDYGFSVEWVGSSKNKILRLAKIISNLKKQPAEVLQSSHFYTNLYAAAAGRVLNIRSIGAIRSDLFREISANGIYGKWNLTAPQHLIANSELARERAIGKGISKEKIDFVRNVVESENGSQKPVEKQSVNILFAGRLDKNKRADWFIELAFQLRQNLPRANLTFQIAGDGPLRLPLEQLAQKRELSKSELSFLGVRQDMPDVYRAADVLVLTSEHEGTPNVILEAMAYGVPVVATKVGGVPEILTEKCGILVEPSDQNALLEATIKLILNKNLRRELGEQGELYVANNHSLDYLQKRLLGIYRNLIK